MTKATRWTVGALLAATLSGAASGCGPAIPTAPTPAAVVAASPPVRPSPEPAAPKPEIGYPARGTGRFTVAHDAGPVVGTRGRLMRYRVAVEGGITGVTASEFAGEVSGILDDPRGWTGTGQWRLQLVPAGARYDFTIYLATPATRDVLCRSAYDRYTSCRRDDKVVLNVARWVHGVPGYGTDLGGYREYMVNHETGHRLYNGHELCPGPGRLAPVMEQQTLGLHGCRPNGWPMVDGRPYHGRSGQYDDPVPRA